MAFGTDLSRGPSGPALQYLSMDEAVTHTTWSELDRYRQVGAVARTLLVAAAAKQWGVAPGDCRVENGFVISGGGSNNQFGNAQNDATRLSKEVQLENPKVSLEETMVAIQKAQIGFTATMHVRNRMVQAYTDIMNMQV